VGEAVDADVRMDEVGSVVGVEIVGVIVGVDVGIEVVECVNGLEDVGDDFGVDVGVDVVSWEVGEDVVGVAVGCDVGNGRRLLRGRRGSGRRRRGHRVAIEVIRCVVGLDDVGDDVGVDQEADKVGCLVG
jgi:hypothetical protein